MTSVNILCDDLRNPNNFMPFIVATPICLFWTIYCIILPIFKKDFYSQFSYLPMATYDNVFYDGLGYDPDVEKVHPFAEKFLKQSSFFKNKELILIILITVASEYYQHYCHLYVLFQLMIHFFSC